MHWFQELSEKFSSGIAHIFLIHGNVGDYVFVEREDGKDTFDPIAQALSHLFKKRDAVVFYNRSAGWRFRNAQEGQLVNNLLTSDAPPTNPLAAMAAKDAGLPKDPKLALPKFEQLLRAGDNKDGPKLAIVLEYAESLFAAGKWDAAGAYGELSTQVVTLLRWATDSQIAEKNNPVILLCADTLSDLHPAIRRIESKIEPIFIPYPNAAERKRFVQWYLKQKTIDMDGITVEQLAHATSALSLTMIEDILLRSQDSGGLKREYVKARKDEIIKAEYADLLEVPEPYHGWEVIGALDYLIDFFNRSVIAPMRKGDYNRVPMGVLLPGPPGTGKSIIAEALAKEAGFGFVKYNPGRSFGRFLGDSEKNTERVFKAIESMIPCIVFIDEIDKAVPSEDGFQGDSGAAMRLLQRLQDFMSDTRHRGKIVFLGATNRPDKISAAMKRAGRFDKKVPVVVPDATGRPGVFKALFTKYGVQFKGKLDDAVKATEGWVGADIENIVIKANEIAGDEGSKVISEKHLATACECILPSVSQEDITFMTALAMKECNDLSLLPPGHRAAAKKSTQVIEEFKARERRSEL